MQQQVLEYFEAYFGETLNESTSDEEIMNAVYDLIDLTEAVLELDEIDRTKLKNKLGAEVARVTHSDKKHTPKTNKQAKLKNKLIDMSNDNSEKEMIKIKLAPGTEIGHEMYGVGPGGKKTLLKKGSTKTPAVINGVIQGDRLDNKKFGTGNVYKPDTVQGK
jgi:hypothetical protein